MKGISIKNKRPDLQKIPKASGVYFFYGPPPFGDCALRRELEDLSPKGRGKLLYIGKAVNLKSRIRSHFANDEANPAKLKMIEQTQKIRWQIAASNVEALIREAELIKKHRPFYNVALRDDKNYFYVGITREKFPRIFLTHQPYQVNKFNSYKFKKLKNTELKNLKTEKLETDFIGPFTDGSAIKNVLNYLRRVFPYCTCPKLHARKCINAELEKCLDFCCNKNSNADVKAARAIYRKNIKNVSAVLSGKKQNLIKTLNREMTMASRRQDFESAVKLRNQILGLKRIFEHRFLFAKPENSDTRALLEKVRKLLGLDILPRRIETYDISNIHGEHAVGSMVVFENGKPNKNEYRKFKIRMKNAPNDTGMIKEILARRLNNPEWPMPELFVIDGGRGQFNAALGIIRARGFQTTVAALAKREEELHLTNKTVRLKNSDREILHFFQKMRDEAHRFAVSYHRGLERRAVAISSTSN